MPADAAAAFEAGDYARAAAVLRAAIARGQGDVETRRSLALVLNRHAAAEFEAGRPGESLALLREAVGHSRDGAITLNLANVQIALKDYAGAAATLDAMGGDERAARLLKDLNVRLAQDAYVAGDKARAIWHYKKAAALDPADASAAERIRKLDRELAAEEGMAVAEGERFRVRFDGGGGAVAGRLASMLLEEAYAKVGADFGYYPDAPVEAVLYPGERFRDVTESPAWAGAVFDGRIKIPVGGITERTALLEKVIFHEYTHVVVHRISRGRAPVWLDEGLAQIEEEKPLRKDEVRELVRAGRADLRSLEGSFLVLGAERAGEAYAISHSAARHMTDEFGMGGAVRVLGALGRGATLDEAMRSGIFVSFDDFERGWKEGAGK